MNFDEIHFLPKERQDKILFQSASQKSKLLFEKSSRKMLFVCDQIFGDGLCIVVCDENMISISCRIESQRSCSHRAVTFRGFPNQNTRDKHKSFSIRIWNCIAVTIDCIRRKINSNTIHRT